jgi:hypothetical protein
MDYVLFGIYTLTTFAFIPLFAAIMRKLALSFRPLYLSVRCKLIVLFVVLMTFLIIRLYLYADVKKLRQLFKDPTIYGVIPFYTSEVIITIAISYVLFAVSSMEKSSNTLREKRSVFESTTNLFKTDIT